MAIWVCKEFGGDMPNVSDELDAAGRERDNRRQKDPKKCIADKGNILDEYYLATAKWDSRTDAVFYLAGAWVAAGIIIDSQPSPDSQDWSASVVIWTGIIFLVWFFLIFGKT
ncbi:MAG: hypothetical protein OXI01_06945 [Albidovulum sp.]|nr:hypothetical protein [Albidovulum sp.]